MAGDVFKLFGSIGLKTEEAEKGLKDVVSEAETTGNKLTSTFKKAAVAIGTAFAVDKVINFGKLSVNAAAEAEEFAGAFEQVFKGFEAEAETSMQNVTDTIKASEGRFKESFLQISGFGKASGMDTEESIELSNRAIIAAADYAAMYGGTLEDTAGSLQSFLKGNYANDAALGVSATEFTRNAAAVELYGAEFNELTETQKQWVLLDMVEKANETSGAMGQAAREVDSYANTMGELKNAWNEFLIIVGGPILKAVVPVIQSVTKGVQWLAEAIVPAAEAVGKFFEGFKLSSGEIRKAINREFKQLMQWFDGFIDIFKEIDFELLLENLIEFGQGAIEVFMEIAEGVLEFLEPIGEYWDNTVETIKTLFQDLVRAFNQAMRGDWSGAFNTLKTAIGEALISMGDNILEAWSGIWDNVKELVTSIDWGATAQSVMTFLGNAISGAVSFLGDIGALFYAWAKEKFDSVNWSEVGSSILEGIYTAVTTVVGWGTKVFFEITRMIVDAFSGGGWRSGRGSTDWLTVAESIMNGILSAISFVIDIFVEIGKAIFDGIKTNIPSDWKEIGEKIVTGIKNALKGTVIYLGDLISFSLSREGGTDFGVDTPLNIMEDRNEQVKRMIEEANRKDSTGQPLPSRAGGGQQFIQQLPGGGGAKSSQYDTLATEATSSMNKVNQAIRQGYEAIRTTFTQMESNMVRLMTQIMTKVQEPVGPGMREINQEFRQGYEPIRTTFTQMGKNLERLMKEAINKVEAAVTANMGKVATAFRSRISDVTEAGRNTGQGFYNGLNSQRTRIVNLANDIATSVLSTMTRALDINSPSGETAWIADMTIQGLYNNLKAGISRIKEITSEVSSAMLFDPQTADLGFAYGQAQTSKPSMTEVMLDEVTQLLKQLRDKDDALYMDGYELGRRGTKYINQENEIRTSRNTRLKGGTAHA